MPLPTEPIGSIPRHASILEASDAMKRGEISDAQFREISQAAVRETIERFEETGSPVISDGEQTKPSFATYPLTGLSNLTNHGVTISFADGHERQLPCLTSGPFRYGVYAQSYLQEAKKYAHVPVKQAVISASALSLLYPPEGIRGYPKESFLEDVISENVADIRGCLETGAHTVQVDFTEARLAIKLDPSKTLLKRFIQLNNRVLDRFPAQQRARIGIHSCPGGDHDSTHSADVDYEELLPSLFELNAGRFYLQLASENDRARVLKSVAEHLRPEQIVFVGVIDPIDPDIETPERVRDRILEAAEYVPLEQLGTTDDCGFSPFGDDASTSRETAFAKIQSRVIGTDMASRRLGISR